MRKNIMKYPASNFFTQKFSVVFSKHSTLLSALLLLTLFFSLLPLSSYAAPAKPVPSLIQQKLQLLTSKRLHILDRNLLHNKSNKTLAQQGGNWVATYYDIDTDSAKFKIKPNKTKGYIASVKYAHLTYTNTGTTKQEAMNGPFTLAKRIWRIEILRYHNGRWE